MSTIGAGWKKTDKNGKPYVSISIDDALLPLTIDSTKKLSLFPITEAKENDKAPDFRLVLFIPKQDEEKSSGAFDEIPLL